MSLEISYLVQQEQNLRKWSSQFSDLSTWILVSTREASLSLSSLNKFVWYLYDIIIFIVDMEITPEYFPDAPEEISEEVEGEKDVAAETKKLDLDDK